MVHDDYYWMVVTAFLESGWLELIVEFIHKNQPDNFQPANKRNVSKVLCLYVLEKSTPGPASTKHDYHSICLGPAAASVFTQTKSSSLTLLKVGTAFVLDHWTELRSYNFVSNTDVNPCKFSHFISVIILSVHYSMHTMLSFVTADGSEAEPWHCVSVSDIIGMNPGHLLVSVWFLALLRNLSSGMTLMWCWMTQDKREQRVSSLTCKCFHGSHPFPRLRLSLRSSEIWEWPLSYLRNTEYKGKATITYIHCSALLHGNWQ